MPDRAVVGVDPGSRYVGLVVRQGRSLLRATILVREDEAKLPDLAFFREVIAVVGEYRFIANTFDPEFLVAVEGVNEPTPQMGKITLYGLLGTAMVYGYLLGRYPEAIVVPPGHNGAGPLGAYPAPLRAPPQKRTQHARSAWDVAGAAPTLAKWLAAP